jgi:hypothetical protein
MSCDSFTTFCQKVERDVGRDVFKSEEWLMECRVLNTNDASEALGGVICGEIKLAVTIHMLAGASYLDLLNQYAVPMISIYSIFHEGTSWINSTFLFPLHIWLETEDWESLNRVSDLFAAASNCVFRGCIRLNLMVKQKYNYYCAAQ